MGGRGVPMAHRRLRPLSLQGTLARLDTATPVLYIDFPCGGRLKFSGRLLFPKTRYAVLRATPRGVLCEDVLEAVVLFAKAVWVGSAADNPTEKELPLPAGVLGPAPARAVDWDAAPALAALIRPSG